MTERQAALFDIPEVTRVDRFRDEWRGFSNFEGPPVRLDGLLYPRVEHAFQAAKSLDDGVREEIRRAPTPGKAKKMGQSVARGGLVVLRADWEEVKVAVMADLLRQKFAHPGPRELLLSSGEMVLIEGNDWHDRFWGVCTGCGQGCRGVGKNNLVPSCTNNCDISYASPRLSERICRLPDSSPGTGRDRGLNS